MSTSLLVFLAAYQAWAKMRHHRALTVLAQDIHHLDRFRIGLLVWVAWIWLGAHLWNPRRIP